MPPPSKNHYDAQPPFPLGVDANTYCYIVPRGTNVIFQDEDGHEITRFVAYKAVLCITSHLLTLAHQDRPIPTPFKSLRGHIGL